jgi:hypothetical protein
MVILHQYIIIFTFASKATDGDRRNSETFLKYQHMIKVTRQTLRKFSLPKQTVKLTSLHLKISIGVVTNRLSMNMMRNH